MFLLSTGVPKECFPGCENVAGKLRQKWKATAMTKFTKPGKHFLATPVQAIKPHMQEDL